MSEVFEIGDPVWAKMKGFPPWPAKIISPPPDVKVQKNKHYVYFFGTDNVAWIPKENITLHSEQQLQNSASKKKTSTLQNAIDAIVAYDKSYKRKKPVSSPPAPSPPKVKKDKSTKDEKPRTKVVKIISSAPKKHERSVFTEKSSLKRKRSSGDLNGHATFSPSTKPALKKFKKSALSIGSRHVPLYSSFFDDDGLDSLPPHPKPIQPSHLRFGFIGMGVMGMKIAKLLIQSGHDITLWNRTPQHCDVFLYYGAMRARSPAELTINCDVTFCCVSSPDAVKSILFGEQGVLMGLLEAKKLDKGRRGFVNMTSTDPDSSIRMCAAVVENGGFYLEAPLWGTTVDAAVGSLVVLAAGNRILFSDCESCFHAMGKNAYYLSCDAGEANKVNLILKSTFGGMCVTLAEAMVVSERWKVEKEDLFTCLMNGELNCPAVYEKARMMASLLFRRVTTLKHMQKDLDMTLMMANKASLPMPITAAANECYKKAKQRKSSDEDISAVYKVVRF